MRKGPALLLAFMLLGGCGGVSITPDRLATLKTVMVARTVNVTPEVMYHGPEQAWGPAVGGALGFLISQGAVGAREQITRYLGREQIDVGEIARAQFVKGLQADPRFAARLADEAETRFELEVYIKGLASSGPFSTQYRPWLGIQAKLIDASGAVLWQDRDHVFVNDAVPLAPYKAYFETPTTFRTGFAAAADVITQSFLKRM